MNNARIFGYSDPLHLKAGERVDFMVSVEGRDEVEPKLVRLVHADAHPDGPGFIEEEIDFDLPSHLQVRRQYTQVGSFAKCADPLGLLDELQSFTCFAHIYPTLAKAERQQIMGRWSIDGNIGFGLGIDPEGHVSLWIGDGLGIDQITTELPLVPRTWYFVAASFDAKRREGQLHVINCVSPWNSRLSTVVPFDENTWIREDLRRAVGKTGKNVPFKLAAATAWNAERGHHAAFLFNGKIDRSGIYDRVLHRDEIVALANGQAPGHDGLLAYWDPTVGLTDKGVGDIISDSGPHGLHLEGVNRPVRCMKGFNWQGEDSYRLAPQTFGGVHYHEDALTDCMWEVTHSITLPENLRSGVYALRLRGGGAQDHIPFIVRPSKPRAKLAVLLPTVTYLAYANEHLSWEAPIAQAIMAHTPIVGEDDIEYKKLEEFGMSTYDHHVDGAGCCYSTWRRPIVTIRPHFRMASMGHAWALPADMSLLWWLEHSGYHYDIITDHDVTAEGTAALSPYMTVINGTHPEYYTQEMMDATEEFLNTGGRVMYLGGNGYYWVTGLRHDEPHCIEVRKLDAGSRAWQAEPGEGYLASTGQRSGLWRSRGRPPQKIVGIGFTAEGFDKSEAFERMPDSFHRRVSWIMEGIGPEEPIGDFGLAGGGAAGVELDRYDLALGTPPHSMLLASSWGHSDNYPLVSEEVTYAFPGRGGTQDAQVRGDMVYFTTPRNGAVFSVGSISWSQALPCKGGQNNVGRIMKNVLQAFLTPGRLPGEEYDGDEKLWR